MFHVGLNLFIYYVNIDVFPAVEQYGTTKKQGNNLLLLSYNHWKYIWQVNIITCHIGTYTYFH